MKLTIKTIRRAVRQLKKFAIQPVNGFYFRVEKPAIRRVRNK